LTGFENKVVIITGASSGIGKALALQLGLLGAKVAITGRNAQNLEQTTNELKRLNINVLAIVADVSLEADNRLMVDKTIETFGQIDILINNAGITMRSLFEQLDDLDVIKRLMDTNFYGTVYATKYALPHIKASKGSIVGISSIAGYRGLPVRTGYSASKFAVNGFLEALRTELLKTGIHILIACPGFTASNIRFSALDGQGNETGETVRNEDKMMSPDEAAYYIIKAIKKRKLELILTPRGRWTVFLNKWLPGIITDRLVYKNLSKEKDSPLAG
jgi:dehydrogenase/reductase SDR family member 7B